MLPRSSNRYFSLSLYRSVFLCSSLRWHVSCGRINSFFFSSLFSLYSSTAFSSFLRIPLWTRVHRSGARYPRRGTDARFFGADFRPFQGNRSHGTEERRKNEGSKGGQCGSSCDSQGGKGPFVSGAPTVNPVRVSVHAGSSCSRRENTVHDSGISRVYRSVALRAESVFTAKTKQLSDRIWKKN